MRRNTQCGRLLHAYVLTYPRWIGGRADGTRYDFSWHTQSQRSGELRDDHGFPCVSQRRRGEQFSEYRIKDEATFQRARLLVKSWETEGGNGEQEEHLNSDRRTGYTIQGRGEHLLVGRSLQGREVNGPQAASCVGGEDAGTQQQLALTLVA